MSKYRTGYIDIKINYITTNIMSNPKKPKTPKTYPVEPDKELLTWEKWITIRKEDTTKLAKLTRRPPADLVMNLYNNFRPERERKIVLEEARILEKIAIRGSLWEQPERLRQSCYCEPVYEVHRTPADLGHPRIVDHVGVPTEIKVQEMGFTGVPERKKCSLLDHDYHQYRDKRENELSKKIMKIDPFRPEIGTLMIKGINPPPPAPKLPLLPQIKETFDSNSSCENLSRVYALRINDTIFIKDDLDQNLNDLKKMQMETWHKKCTSWSYYFNVPVNRAGRGKLYLKNLGTVTIRYCWKKIKKSIPFIPEESEQMFFFNKNEDLIAPGQEKYICFTFLTDKPGIHKEYWELSLSNIIFFDTLLEKLVIHLVADAVEDYNTTNLIVEQLKSDIYVKSIQNFITELIDETISKAVSIQPEIYPYKDYFLEAEIFVMKNPVCFYHQTEVMKMKELYSEMSKDKEWDLSIKTWRELMLTKQFDERMKYYGLLQKSHSDFLKPWYEGEDLMKSKYRAMMLLLGQLADNFDLERDRITSICNPPDGESVVSTVSTSAGRPSRESVLSLSQPNLDLIRNLYFIKMYEHIGNTIEACAGVLSSLDLDRWIEFDFCRT